MGATLLEGIQQQINEIVAAIARIQARILELVAEQAKKTPAISKEPLKESGVAESVEIPAKTDSETASTSTDPVWKFMPLPSTYLTQPLAILYRFSVTGGTADMTLPSVKFTVALADVSIKNVELFAFSDEAFSLPTFLRNSTTKQNRVGRQIGFIDPNNSTMTILLDQGPPAVKILAGRTYYFELRGTVVAKNKSAFLTIGAESLSSLTLE